MNLGPFGFWEMLVIAALALLLFGPQKLPDLARSLSRAVREFRRGLNEASRDLQEEFREAEARSPSEPKPAEPKPAEEVRPALPAAPDEETTHR